LDDADDQKVTKLYDSSGFNKYGMILVI